MRIRLGTKVEICTVIWIGLIHFVENKLYSTNKSRAILTMCDSEAYSDDGWNVPIDKKKMCKICVSILESQYGIIDLSDLEVVKKRHRKRVSRKRA